MPKEKLDHFLRYYGHTGVLLGGLLVAFGLWLFWLFAGMAVTHQVLAASAQTAVASASMASAPMGVASTPAVTDRERMFAELGQTGDAFGGLNAILTAIAGAVVAWAGFMQHQTLKQARLAAVDERKHREHQEFESLFFQLLALTASSTEKIERRRPVDPHTKKALTPHVGSRALDSFAASLFDKGASLLGKPIELEQRLERLVGEFLKIYDHRPSAFGPYFRLQYQTFKQIADAPVDDEKKIRYANIARGQISEGAVLLLALNGLTRDGHDFAPLIERFGLLEHLHRRYKQYLLEMLKVGYRDRAFMGSAARCRPENAWEHKPLLAENRFALDANRQRIDDQRDFESGFDSEDGAGA